MTLGKHERAQLFKRATRELEPTWGIFRTLKPRDWGWQYLRRNEEYTQLSNEIKKSIGDLSVILTTQEIDDYFLGKDFNRQRLEQAEYFHCKEIHQKVLKFGLVRWHDPDQETISDWLWFEPINGKMISEYYLGHALDREKRIVNDLKLMPYEDILIINYRVPHQIYTDEIERLYEERGLKEEFKPYQVDKIPDSLKAFDLRKWGEQEDRCIVKNGVKESCIGWSRIGHYLRPKAPMSVSTVKDKYQTACDRINGEYLQYMRFKSHT